MAEFMVLVLRQPTMKCEAALVHINAGRRGLSVRRAAAGAAVRFGARAGCTSSCTACRHQCSVISGTMFEAIQAGAVALVFGDAPADPVQEQRGGARTHAPPGRLLRRPPGWSSTSSMEVMRVREADRQLDGRVEIDDAYLGGERSGGKAGRGSENKVAVLSPRCRLTPEGQPQFVCLRQQPFTHEEVAVFAARSIAPSATVVSDGLWCFGAVQIVGADHERVVTGGGKASTKLPSLQGGQHVPGQPQGVRLSGTYHAFDFAKYAHRYLARGPVPVQPVDSICAPSCPGCFAPPASQLQLRRTSFVRLRLVANQVAVRPTAVTRGRPLPPHPSACIVTL